MKNPAARHPFCRGRAVRNTFADVTSSCRGLPETQLALLNAPRAAPLPLCLVQEELARGSAQAFEPLRPRPQRG